MNRADTLTEIRRVLALDQACDEDALLGDGVYVVESQRIEGRRKFPFRTHRLGAVTMGGTVVVSCDAGRMPWVRKTLGDMNRDDVFSATTIALLTEFVAPRGQSMAGPDLKFACDDASLRMHEVPAGVDVALLREGQAHELYAFSGFGNALQYSADSDRPDVLVCVARVEGQVIGVAGASADCDSMWQVGIDVVEGHWKRGIGKALVAQLTQAILGACRVPYYSTTPANIPSRALAISVGYWPAWVELYAT